MRSLYSMVLPWMLLSTCWARAAFKNRQELLDAVDAWERKDGDGSPETFPETWQAGGAGIGHTLW